MVTGDQVVLSGKIKLDQVPLGWDSSLSFGAMQCLS